MLDLQTKPAETKPVNTASVVGSVTRLGDRVIFIYSYFPTRYNKYSNVGKECLAAQEFGHTAVQTSKPWPGK